MRGRQRPQKPPPCLQYLADVKRGLSGVGVRPNTYQAPGCQGEEHPLCVLSKDVVTSVDGGHGDSSVSGLVSVSVRDGLCTKHL